MAEAWGDGVTAVYGKQISINHEGLDQPAETEALNRDYYRRADLAGEVLASIEAVLVAQFPNDGFLVEATAAKETLYREKPISGDLCDFEFGLRLGVRPNSRFVFLDEFTAKYRDTAVSVLKNAPSHGQLYEILADMQVDGMHEWARECALQRIAPFHMAALAGDGRRRAALGVYFSKRYPNRNRFSRPGVRLLIRLVFGF